MLIRNCPIQEDMFNNKWNLYLNEYFGKGLSTKIIWLWTILIISADIKKFYSHIHWDITLVIILLLLPELIKIKYRSYYPLSIAASILILAIILTAMYHNVRLYDLIEAGKLLFILLGAQVFFVTRPDLAKVSFRAFQGAVILNIFLLLLGIAISPVLASMMTGDGRWGTILNFPGSLWRVGIAVFFYSAYRIFHNGMREYFQVFMMISCLLLIFFDGSRTGQLILLVALVYLLYLVYFEKKYDWKTNLFRFCNIIILVLLTGALVNITATYLKVGFLHRSLPCADSARLSMLKIVIKDILAHPLMGNGMGTTVAKTIYGTMVVHSSYLQVWADVGFLGFLSYTCLLTGWLYWLPKCLIKIREMKEIEDRALYYNAAFVLLAFALAGLFHPISTEWSEWAMFLMALSLFWEKIKGKVECLPEHQNVE